MERRRGAVVMIEKFIGGNRCRLLALEEPLRGRLEDYQAFQKEKQRFSNRSGKARPSFSSVPLKCCNPCLSSPPML